MVLAIGIVVDDAIVVVENVERVMEEEPDLTPAEATKKAMAQITAPIIAITLVLLSVFVPIGFIPGISGTAVPPVRGDDQRRDADLGDQRADAVARAVRRVPAPHRAAARHHGPGRCAASTRCATAMPRSCARLVRVAVLAVVLVAVFGGGIFGAGAAHADRLPAGGGPGRVLRRRAAAGRRLASTRTREVVQRVEEHAASRCPQIAERAVDRRLLAARRRRAVQRRLHGRCG